MTSKRNQKKPHVNKMLPLVVNNILEGHEQKEFDDCDQRIFQLNPFGASNDSWATILIAYMGWKGLTHVRYFLDCSKSGAHDPWKPRGWGHTPVDTELYFRIKSETFEETDSRFLRLGQPIGLVQSTFNRENAEEYIRSVVQRYGNSREQARLQEYCWIEDH